MRKPDPSDQRATLITFTPLGWQFLRDTHAIKSEIEPEYAAALGEGGLQALKDSLIILLQAETTPDKSEKNSVAH